MKLILASLLLICVLSPTPDQNLRIRKLEGSLMAPCCYSQTIDEHVSMEGEMASLPLLCRLTPGSSAKARRSCGFAGRSRCAGRGRRLREN